MPHRVTTFFRSHTSNFDLPTDLKSSSRRSSSSKRPPLSDRASSSSASSVNSDHGHKMPDHKRISLTGLHSPKNSSTKIHQSPASLDVKIESPPLVFFGPPVSSTGALLSGQLMLNVPDELLVIDNFKLKLVVETTRKKPFHAHCAECSQQTQELYKWDFLQGQATLKKGKFKN